MKSSYFFIVTSVLATLARVQSFNTHIFILHVAPAQMNGKSNRLRLNGRSGWISAEMCGIKLYTFRVRCSVISYFFVFRHHRNQKKNPHQNNSISFTIAGHEAQWAKPNSFYSLSKLFWWIYFEKSIKVDSIRHCCDSFLYVNPFVFYQSIDNGTLLPVNKTIEKLGWQLTQIDHEMFDVR